MKYSEFEKEVKALGLELLDGYNMLVVETETGTCVMSISTKYFADITTDSTETLPYDKMSALLKLATELATTPLEEREEEKKYNVVACRRKTGYKGFIKEKTFFYYRMTSGCLSVSDDDDNDELSQQWTLQQIREWDLESCERIEVKN